MYGKLKEFLTNELEGIKAAGLYKNERIITTPQRADIKVNAGSDVLNFCANNYLGLSDNQRLIKAAKEAMDTHGYGMSSVRFICGTQDLHKQLEAAISDYFKTEDTILYAACFDANGGLFEPLFGEEDAIISDALNHASIIDGVRLCKAKRYRYANADMADLERCLQEAQAQRHRIIATDGVFSMDGNVAPMDKICELAGVTYGDDYKTDVSIRVITDHIRSVTFMVSDGILPSNSGRGYVLRRLLRRACRHGKLLGIDGAFLVKLATTVIEGSKDGYPELEEKKEFIFNVIAKEEANFNKTIDQGLAILADMEAEMEKNGEKVLSGENAFKLYDTYGFPIDLTSEILEEKGLTYDEEGFKKAQEEQRAKSEGTFGTHSYTGKEVSVYDQLDAALETEFVGYDNLTFDSKVTALTTETEVVDALSDGEKGTIIVEQTPFYATMGGQEADKGVIRTADGEFVVEDCIHLAGTKVGHVGHVVKGMIKIGDAVTLEVDAKNRALTERNHSATHLLQKALRTVLGSHVEQAGSFVNADRLRFDFTHFSAVTPEELKKVEEIVNEQITNALAVVTKNLPIEEARKTGAQALFGEKYGDVVRVVDMSGFSVEFCGGTHVKNTSEITALKIISESGVAAGVRRIEALTSEGLMNYYAEMERLLKEAAQLVKATPENLAEKITHLQAENKTLKGEVERLKSKMAQSAAGDILDQVKEVKGVKLLAAQLDGVDMNGLRDLGDQLKEKLGEGVVVLASGNDGKVSLMATATDGAMKQGAHAGNLVKAIAGLVGGGGGGRPNMAQAGGKNPAGIPDALAKAEEALADQIK